MKVLLIVDVQPDFCPGGALAVPQGDQVVPVINRLMDSGEYDLVVATQDWHPRGHKSFASSHEDGTLFSVIDLNGLPQTLWPEHCVQGTDGARLHPDLDISRIDKVVQKGTNPELDSYSGFFDNAKRQSTGLADYLEFTSISYGCKGMQDIEVYVVGLATDYCVKATAIDAAERGYNTSLIIEACRAVNINPRDDELALREMLTSGVSIISAKEILAAAGLPAARQNEIPLQP